jgi:predicted transcriptional regulator
MATAPAPANLEKIRRALELKKEGYSLADIARKIKVSPSSVSNYLYKRAPQLEAAGALNPPPPEKSNGTATALNEITGSATAREKEQTLNTLLSAVVTIRTILRADKLSPDLKIDIINSLVN